MSILQRFLILFESDASDVKKGAKEAETATKNLNNSLTSTKSNIDNIARALTTIGSVGAVISGIMRAVSPVQELGDIARELDVNIEMLDAWGKAVQRTGGNASSLQNTLRNLSKTFGSTAQEALDSLPNLSDALSKMSNTQARFYGQSLGIDQATIYLLQKGRKEIEALIRRQQELGLITTQDVFKTRELNDAVFDLKNQVSAFSRAVTMPLIPGLTQVFEFLVTHKDLVKGAFLIISAGIAAFGAASLAANPAILAVTASLSAFALIYEELQQMLKGGSTFIGDVGRVGAKIAATDTDALAQRFLGLVGIGTTARQGSSIANSKTVNVGDVTINTQATSGRDVAQEVSSLLSQLEQANSQFDSGVRI